MAYACGGLIAKSFTLMVLSWSTQTTSLFVAPPAVHDRNAEVKPFELTYSASGAPADAGKEALIPGSDYWLTCLHKHTHQCGKHCCCDAGSFSDAKGTCVEIEDGKIKGWMPQSGSNLPVFVWLTGTMIPFWDDSANRLTKEMAKHGYIAAQVYYPGNADFISPISYPDCDGLEDKAQKVFGHPGGRHATYRLCAKERANCSNGLAVAGWSQGAQIAAWADRINKNVSAVLYSSLTSYGKNPMPGLGWIKQEWPCLRNHTSKAKRLQVVAEDDEGSIDPLKQQKETSGYDCGDDHNCIQVDGSGYYILAAKERGDSMSPHGYFMNTNCLRTTCQLSAKFISTNAPWGMQRTLDWLAKAARQSSP